MPATTMDPEVSALFNRVVGAKYVVPTNALDARERSNQSSLKSAGTPIELQEVSNLDHPRIPMRLYRPHDVLDPAPCMIFLHGGGWVTGNLDTHDRECRKIAYLAGIVVIAIDYRLAPEYPAPTAAEDAIEALHWIYAEDVAKKLRIDRTKMAVGGDSAGGNLAAVLSIEARDKKIPLKCQILAYPAVDIRDEGFGSIYPSHTAPDEDVWPLIPASIKFYVGCYVKNADVARHWKQSPIVADLHGVAPALILTGDRDALHDEAIAYADKLRTSGVPVLLRTFPGMIHAFVTMASDLPKASNAGMDTIAFMLKQYLN